MASAVAAAAPMIKQHQAALRKLSEANLAKTDKPAEPNGLLNQQSNQQDATNQPAAAAAAQQANKKPRKQPKPPERAPRALFCLDLKNPIRKRCIAIVEYQYPLHKIHISMFEFF